MFKMFLLASAALLFCLTSQAADQLLCKTGSNGKFFLHNATQNRVVDMYAFKTLDNCQKIVAASRYGITCTNDMYGKAVLFNFEKNQHIDQYSVKTDEECLQTLRVYKPLVGLICMSNSNKNASVYNVKKSKFVDTYSTKSLSECNRTVLASRDGLTCISSDSSGKVALYDYVSGRYVDQYSKPLKDCLDSLR